MKYIVPIAVLIPIIIAGYVAVSLLTTPSQEVPYANTSIVTVGPEHQSCTGVAPQECLVVDGELFYDTIEGFTFEPGFEYVLEITQTERSAPPADAGSLQYELIEVVSKLPASGVEQPTIASDNALAGVWQWVETERGPGEDVVPVNETAFTLSFSDGQVAITTDCNNGSGSYQHDGQELLFGPIAATKMACPGETQEAVFFELLGDVRTYEIYSATTTRLVLMSEESDSVFEQVNE